MPFTEIIGHDRQVDILKRALANNALAHAYLFSGEPGIGKRLTASTLAAALNCATPGPDGGCGACPSCHKVAAGLHPDVRIVMPESQDEQLLATWNAKEVEKASDEIKIDQVRQAQENMALRPFEGRKKVLIVDGAETMNDTAQNAFLKTLEEPPGESLIILVTAMPQGLLPTIRSRCQALAFQPLPRSVLASVLRDRRGLGEDDAWFLAALSRGSLGRALEMDVAEERTARAQFKTLVDGIGRLTPDEVLSLAEGMSKDRDGFSRMIEIGIEWLRDRIVYAETGEEQLLVFPGGIDRTAGRDERLAVSRALRDLNLFTESRKLLDRRVSAQLVAENLFLKLGRV